MKVRESAAVSPKSITKVSEGSVSLPKRPRARGRSNPNVSTSQVHEKAMTTARELVGRHGYSRIIVVSETEVWVV